MKHALPPLTKDLIEAFAASAVAWCVGLIGVIARFPGDTHSFARPGCSIRQRRANECVSPGRRRLTRLVALLERAVESIVFLMALHRFGPIPHRRRFPRLPPRGFRRRVHCRRRLFFRNSGVRARKAGLVQRIGRLIAVMAAPEPYIAYFVKRLIKSLRGAHLVAAAPPASALAAPPCYAAAFADTS